MMMLHNNHICIYCGVLFNVLAFVVDVGFSCIFTNFQHAAVLQICLEESGYEHQEALVTTYNPNDAGFINENEKQK